MARLIAIEGIDGSGKGTQAARLAEALRSSGYRVDQIGFPRYEETFFGQRIGDFLNGRFGPLGTAHPFLVSLLFAGDRFESRERLLSAIDGHDYVILDRYVASNIAHQTATCSPEEAQVQQEWIEHLEFELYRLPRPDQVLVLDIPATTSAELIARKSPRSYTEATRDLQESDIGYQEAVRRRYLQLGGDDPAWKIVSCLGPDGTLLPIPAITETLLQFIAET